MLFIQRHSKFVASLIFLLAFLTILTPFSSVIAQSQLPNEKLTAEQIVRLAEMDAEQDATVGAAWIGGFFCGIFGWLGTILSSPDVPAARLVGKSSDYVVIYSSAYKDKIKSKRTTAACTGWAIGSTVSLVIVLAIGPSKTTQ